MRSVLFPFILYCVSCGATSVLKPEAPSEDTALPPMVSASSHEEANILFLEQTLQRDRTVREQVRYFKQLMDVHHRSMASFVIESNLNRSDGSLECELMRLDLLLLLATFMRQSGSAVSAQITAAVELQKAILGVPTAALNTVIPEYERELDALITSRDAVLDKDRELQTCGASSDPERDHADKN